MALNFNSAHSSSQTWNTKEFEIDEKEKFCTIKMEVVALPAPPTFEWNPTLPLSLVHLYL